MQGEPEAAKVVLFVFAPRVLELGPPSRSKHGLPAGYNLENIEVQAHLRSDNEAWFDGFFDADMRAMSRVPLPQPEHMAVVYSIRHIAEFPRDLAYLQACWAIAKWLCDLGASLVHNANAIEWKSGLEVLALDPFREFDLGFEINCIFESQPTEGFGHLTHTRGMLNFGHPDLLLFGGQPEYSRQLGMILNLLAEEAALGRAFKAGERLGPGGLPARELFAYEPETRHPQVHLNNEGLCLDVHDWALETLYDPG